MSIVNTISVAHISTYQQRTLKIIAACLTMLIAPHVQATCTIKEGIVAQNIDFGAGRILIQPSLAIGDRIALLTHNINRVEKYAGCVNNGIMYGDFTRSMTPVSGMNHVYATDVAGVGIRLYREAGKVSTFYPHTFNSNNLPGRVTYLTLNEGYFQVELIKTAATTGSGPIASPGPFTTYYADGSGISRPILTSSLSGIGITIVTSTCQVDAGSKNIAVNFGSVSSNTFKGLGSKGPERDFTINLICHGGNVTEADQAQISVRIDGTQDSSGQSGVLAITSASDAASNIGIELVDLLTGSERQVVFGQAITLGRTAINASSTLSLPMRARYIQTQTGKVGPGAAKGTATFTIEYQ
ncbi:fimbrial protein [Xylella fastidiosa]|uniref:Fimbrial protein n=1 Tax=Xylella fastidiosa subsp. sandyi Ann-1 TaxID=155920 RepID=A0A060H7A7_XYLFS|nr:fimbrial protein [Xylella fastidiosa]AIC09246.1 fimbrial protein [Xylella fastidiosa subsp. sandyi Ann-1]UIX81381.1 type 1 fimbrial protein [Xylella fastidiosa subsp. sandyi]